MAKTDGRFSTVIRTSVRVLFFKEKQKGRLINDLLENHYKTATPNINSKPTNKQIVGEGVDKSEQ